MTKTMVRYKARPDQATLNEALIRGVFDELHELQPEAFSYKVFVLDDGVSVVHIVEYEGSNPLPGWPRSSATALMSASAWKTGRYSASCARSARSRAVRGPATPELSRPRARPRPAHDRASTTTRAG